MPLTELLVEAGLASSKGDARRNLEGGGVYLNNRRVADPRAAVRLDDAIDGELVVLRKGRRRYHLVRLRGGRQPGTASG
jgi:tyrosyl-tRNA synthetase